MRESVRKKLLAVGGLIFLLVVIDHITTFCYDLFLYRYIHSDSSLYLEILSLLFTVAVPFLYSRYKKRENFLEEQAVSSGGSVEDLLSARDRNDAVCISYYIAMITAVLVLSFLQSNIIIAGQKEAVKLEQTIASIHQSLRATQEALSAMGERLKRMDSLLHRVSQSSSGKGPLFDLVSNALIELNQIHKITSDIDSSLKTTQSEMYSVNMLQTSPISLDIRGLRRDMARFETGLAEIFEAEKNVLAKIQEIDQKVTVLSRKSSSKPPPKNDSTDSKSFSNIQLQVINRLIGAYYVDFVARYGEFELSNESGSILLERFREYLQRRGYSVSEVKSQLSENSYMIEDMLTLCRQGALPEIKDCEKKLTWLKFLSLNL